MMSTTRFGRSRAGKGRFSIRLAVVCSAVLGAMALASCGSSKPGYCSDVPNLENSIKGLANQGFSGSISSLKAQVMEIQSAATAAVTSAKSDLPNETRAVESSLETLGGAVKSLSSNSSPSQLASVANDASGVVNSVNGFVNATKSKCS